MSSTVHPTPPTPTAPAAVAAGPLDPEPGPEDGAGELVRRAAPEPTPDEVRTLAAALADEADDAGLLDLAYRTVDSPYGELLLAATPVGLVRVAFESEGHDDVLASLSATVSPRLLRSGRRTDAAARQLEEYFERRRDHFDLPVDLRLVAGFRREVVDHLRTIPYGSTRSYAEVARGAGRPTAVRAAGSACARNPVPIVVPCHRVVRSDGSVGQYLGGSSMKVALLAMERAA